MKTLMDLVDKLTKHDCEPLRSQARAALEQRIKELEADAKRYRWLREENNTKHSVGMNIALDHYGLEWDDLIDRAMSEAALTKAVEISQEYKLP